MRYGIIGESSAIAQEFVELADGEIAYSGRPDDYPLPLNLDRYLICTGYLAGKSLLKATLPELEATWRLNFVVPAKICELVFGMNANARVCVIGSESGFSGSYDAAYSAAKAALHHYVETKRLVHAGQMLVAVAPHIIWDSAMTQSRPDLAQLAQRGVKNRLGRWLSAREVAEQALALLNGSPALSGTIVRMRAN